MLRRRTKHALGQGKTRGQSLVEFALILPVFMLLFGAALDLGRLAAARIAVANAAREGAFQASTTPTSYTAGAACPTPDANGDVPDNLVICRTLLESKGGVVAISPSNVALSCSPNCTPALGSTATVKVTGQFTFITPFMAAIFGGQTLNFSASSTTQLDFLPTPIPTIYVSPTATPTAAPTATATAGPTPSPTPVPTANCSAVSAGFTFTKSPSNNKSPVTVTVTDTTTYNSLCSTVWVWNWGDGSTTFGRTQSPHVYYNATASNITYTIALTVTSGAYTSTYGGQTVLVKP